MLLEGSRCSQKLVELDVGKSPPDGEGRPGTEGHQLLRDKNSHSGSKLQKESQKQELKQGLCPRK